VNKERLMLRVTK